MFPTVCAVIGSIMANSALALAAGVDASPAGRVVTFDGRAGTGPGRRAVK